MLATPVAEVLIGKIGEFEALLERAGVTKAELARRLGLQPNSVYNWKLGPPSYAAAYLKLLIEYNRVRP